MQKLTGYYMRLSCLACQRRVRAVCHNYSFWTFLFLFLGWNKNRIESVLSWTRITVSDTLKKNCSCFVMWAGDHVYRLFYLAVGKLADIPFRDVNFLGYFGCSNIRFLEFLISLGNFRLTWRIVAPTRRKIARKLGDISGLSSGTGVHCPSFVCETL